MVYKGSDVPHATPVLSFSTPKDTPLVVFTENALTGQTVDTTPAVIAVVDV